MGGLGGLGGAGKGRGVAERLAASPGWDPGLPCVPGCCQSSLGGGGLGEGGATWAQAVV